MDGDSPIDESKCFDRTGFFGFSQSHDLSEQDPFPCHPWIFASDHQGNRQQVRCGRQKTLTETTFVARAVLAQWNR